MVAVHCIYLAEPVIYPPLKSCCLIA